MIIYQLIEEKHNNDIIGNYTSFGVNAVDSFSGKNCVYIEDVFTNEKTAEECIALFNEEQMRHAVVGLVVAQSHHVGRKHVHDLDGRKTHEVGVDDRTPEHVAGDAVQDVLLLLPHLVDVAGQHRNAAHKLVVLVFGEEIAGERVGS